MIGSSPAIHRTSEVKTCCQWVFPRSNHIICTPCTVGFLNIRIIPSAFLADVFVFVCFFDIFKSYRKYILALFGHFDRICYIPTIHCAYKIAVLCASWNSNGIGEFGFLIVSHKCEVATACFSGNVNLVRGKSVGCYDIST